MARRRTELAAAVAVASAAAAMLLGGAFWPMERAAVGVGLSVALGAAAAIGWREWTPAERTVGLLLAWACVSAVATAHDRSVARDLVAAWAAAAAVWLLARRAGGQALRLQRAMVAVAVAVAAVVAVDAVMSRTVRASGMFDSPNLAAAVLVPLLPAAWCGVVGRGLRLPVSAVLAAGIVATGSRAGVLAALASALVLAPRGRVRRRAIAAAVAAAAAVTAWRLWLVPDPLAWHRPAIWGALLRLTADHPVLGTGPGSLADAAGPYRLAHPERVVLHEHAIGTADSTVVALAVALGVVGLALAGVALWRLGREMARPGGREPAPWWVGSAVGMAVLALFHDLLAAEPLLWWWAAAIGLAVPATTVPARRWWPAAVAGLGLGLLGLVAPNVARVAWRSAPPDADRIAAVERLDRWLAEPFEWRASSLLAQPAWSWSTAAEAAAASDRVVAIRPGVWSAWLIRARVAARTAVELGPWPEVVDEARRSFDRAAALEPHLPWAWLDRARFERAVAGGDAARPFVERALEAEPRCAPAWLLEARLAIEDGRLDAAAAALERVERAGRLFASAGGSGYAYQVLTVPPHELERLRGQVR